jgi:hypothetical protein
MKLQSLRNTLAHRFPDALPRPGLPPDALPFGIDALDAILPSGGLARGRLSEIVGPTGSGRTSLVKSLVRATSGPVAIVDPDRSLAPSDFVRDAATWIVRADPLWAADVLLRSGAFSLVVVFVSDGRSPRPGSASSKTASIVRLQRLAEESAAVCLFAGDTPRGSSLVTTRLATTGGEWLMRGIPPAISGRRITASLEKGGPRRRVEIEVHEEETDRLLAHPEAPDRAPVAWRGEGGRREAPRFARG